MKKFREIYLENDDDARLTLGYDKKAGKLYIMTPYEDAHSDPRSPRYSSAPTFAFDAAEAFLKIGEAHIGQGGKIEVGYRAIILDGGQALLTVGANGAPNGKLLVNNRLGNPALSLDGETATLTIGAPRSDGMLIMQNSEGERTVELNGRHANLVMGGAGADGDLTLRSDDGQDRILLNGSGAGIIAGGAGADGDLILRSDDGQDVIRLQASVGNITAGGAGQDGDLILRNANGDNAIVLNGSGGEIIAGGVGTNGDIIVKNNRDVETIRITGSDGDITFLNADFAEEFEIAATAVADSPPGTVMILNADGALEPSRAAYDPKVVGVIAGAGGYQPALVLDKRAGPNRRPVAMIGKVHCRVSAETEPVRIGDLLTTSATPGHAMKAGDRGRALGAIIGKALGDLPSGTGLVPVLVNLQ